MSLLSELKGNDKKGLFSSDNNTVFYSTGFPVLDYANGTWSKVYDSDGNAIIKPLLGLSSGSLCSIIGTTSTGKSTMAIQIGWNIVKNFSDGILFINDCEKLNMPERVTAVTGTSPDEERIVLMKNNTDIESALAIIDNVCKMKAAGGKKYMYEIKDGSVDGKSFWKYQPSVFIIDSLPAFNSPDYNTSDLGNQIDQMKASKDITRFYTNILDKAWQYNIIIIAINHVKPASNTNQYAPPVQGLLMINAQTETLPRGQAAQYFSSTYFRIRTKKGDAYTEDDNGFKGYKSSVQIAKSKTNIVGTTFPLAFNGVIGYDPVYSHFEFAQSIGLIQGRNPYLYFLGAEDYKFSRKNFFNKYYSDKDFREVVEKTLEPYYMELLGPKPELFYDEDGKAYHTAMAVVAIDGKAI